MIAINFFHSSFVLIQFVEFWQGPIKIQPNRWTDKGAQIEYINNKKIYNQ